MSDPTQQRPDAEERTKAVEAVTLRRTGLSWREIADQLGYRDESGARKAATRLLGRVEVEAVGELRELEGQRLDALQAAHWNAALAGDVDSTKVVLGVIDRRCRLFGLNAPDRVEVGSTVTDAEFAEAAVGLIAALRPDMAAALAGTLPGAARSAVPEGNGTGETVLPASVAHSAGNDDEPEPWADVDGPTEPVVSQQNTDTDGVVEPEPEPAPVIPPAGRPDLARRAPERYGPPVALGGFSQRLGGLGPPAGAHNQP